MEAWPGLEPSADVSPGTPPCCDLTLITGIVHTGGTNHSSASAHDGSCSAPAAKRAESWSVLCPTSQPGPHHHLSLQGRASFVQL